jgi:TolB-like protein/DNA-binding winged helix-turn-helix (wHTH) protein/tetratricopeptide (TPR) repeat protein
MAGLGLGIPEKPIRFGDCELNSSAFELRRGRRTMKLERIPLQVLLILIEQNGKVVTREAIAEQVWGRDVFLDVDNGINTAIRKIRHLLNDDPQKPRFVETIPGVGYRFIARLEKEARSEESEASHEEASPAGTGMSAEANVAVANDPGVSGGRGFWSRYVVVIVTLLCAAGVGGWLGWRHSAGQRHVIRSIAVIPLQNLSGDASQDYFADGMTEELITELARIDSLRVISHTSVMGYKGTSKHLPEIARELGVDAILEGSVIRENENVRVTVQLLDGPADRHIWGEEYERPLNGVLNLQRDVGKAIAQEVRAKLSATEDGRLRAAHVVNPTAYDNYLKGRFYFDTGFSKADSLKKAQRYFEESIKADPNFAQPYAGLSNTYIYMAFAGVLKRDQAYRSAMDAVTRALELDEGVGEAHDTLGVLKWQFEWDWQAAEQEFNRAMALAPSYSCAHEDRAIFLAYLGRRDEALAEIAKIDQLDFGISAAQSEALVFASLRDYPNMIAANNRALLLDPNEWFLHYNLGTGYEAARKVPEAMAEDQKAIAMSGGPEAYVGLAHVYSSVGRRAEAQKILIDLEHRVKASASPYAMAMIYAGLGDKDRAFALLDEAVREKSLELSSNLKGDIRIDDLRGDPRFQNLLSSMKLPSR